MRLIDINAHLGPYPFRRLRFSTPEGLLDLMDRSGIDHALVASNPAVFYRDVAGGDVELAESVARSDGRLSGIATVKPTYAGWRADLDRALDEWNFKAVRLLPAYHPYELDDADGRAALDLASRRGVPVAFVQRLEDRRQQHPWDHAADMTFDRIAEAARAFPDLKVIFQNWLGLDPKAVRDAGLKGRCLIDITRPDTVLTGTIDRLIDDLGVESLAFGTHMPFNYTAPVLVKLEVLDVSDADREKIAWKNAASFLNLAVAPTPAAV